MPVRELGTMTWEEAHELAASEPIAVLPVGAIEAHGPHLPVDTDVIIAAAMARAGAELLAERDLEVLILPPLAYTPAPFACDFPGTYSIRPQTMSALLVDLARSAASQGVCALAIANAHLDPTHLRSLHDAGDEVRDEGDVLWVFPDITRRPWGARLTDEFRSGACHAGRYETSIVLAERPERVRDARRRELAPVPHSLSDAYRDGKRTFGAAGGADAYFGDPAAATAAEGELTIRELGGILADAVLEALGRAA